MRAQLDLWGPDPLTRSGSYEIGYGIDPSLEPRIDRAWLDIYEPIYKIWWGFLPPAVHSARHAADCQHAFWDGVLDRMDGKPMRCGYVRR